MKQHYVKTAMRIVSGSPDAPHISNPEKSSGVLSRIKAYLANPEKSSIRKSIERYINKDDDGLIGRSASTSQDGVIRGAIKSRIFIQTYTPPSDIRTKTPLHTISGKRKLGVWSVHDAIATLESLAKNEAIVFNDTLLLKDMSFSELTQLTDAVKPNKIIANRIVVSDIYHDDPEDIDGIHGDIDLSGFVGGSEDRTDSLTQPEVQSGHITISIDNIESTDSAPTLTLPSMYLKPRMKIPSFNMATLTLAKNVTLHVNKWRDLYMIHDCTGLTVSATSNGTDGCVVNGVRYFLSLDGCDNISSRVQELPCDS